MEFRHFHDSRLSVATDSGLRTAVDNRWQSNIRDTGYFSVSHSIFHGDRLGFSGRRSKSNSRKPVTVNRVKLGIPYKSQLCTLFQEGKCYFGENCHFAHSLKENRKIGFSDVSVEANVNEDARRKAMWEMKEYHYFSRGEDYHCGEKCQFIRKYDKEDLSDARFHYKSDLRKTKLCKKWERFGSCPYGVKCCFAHGKAASKFFCGYDLSNTLLERGEIMCNLLCCFVMTDVREKDDLMYRFMEDITELRECSLPVDLEMSYTSRLKLALQPCEIGIETAETEKLELRGKRRCMNWSIKKISQIYADWVDKDLNSPVSSVDVPK